MIGNTRSTWGSVARWFHWGLGAAIIGMLAYGWWMNHIPARPDRYFYRSIHADIGYVLLLLTVLRLIWRGVNPTPSLPGDMPPWLRVLARLNQWALYLATILVAMLGWAHSGARTPDYSSFFGLFHVPQITSPDRPRQRPMRIVTSSSPMCCSRWSCSMSWAPHGITSPSAIAFCRGWSMARPAERGDHDPDRAVPFKGWT